MKLISMIDFVLEQLNEENSRTRPIRSVLNALESYANFLKQPLKLEMFVPCDENGNVLEEPQMRPERNSFDEEDMDYDAQELYDYIKAKEKVLFEGFYIHHTVLFYPNQVAFCDISEWETPDWMNIEWLLNNSFQYLQLTPTAIKRIQP